MIEPCSAKRYLRKATLKLFDGFKQDHNVFVAVTEAAIEERLSCGVQLPQPTVRWNRNWPSFIHRRDYFVNAKKNKKKRPRAYITTLPRYLSPYLKKLRKFKAQKAVVGTTTATMIPALSWILKGKCCFKRSTKTLKVYGYTCLDIALQRYFTQPKCWRCANSMLRRFNFSLWL